MLRYLLLDLDDTVYSESSGLEREVLVRINEYARRLTGLSREAFMEERKRRMPDFGTTLEWIMADYGFADAEDYFAFVHPEGEEKPLAADPELASALDAIDLPKAIFTNSPREHAERVLARLGVADRFDAIYDIRFNGLHGKPHADAIGRVCAACGVEPPEALFVDDSPKYVRGFIDLGGIGVLRDETGRHGDLGLVSVRNLSELPALVAALAKEGS
jgi:putative hydrolase of the HAD superfamily